MKKITLPVVLAISSCCIWTSCNDDEKEKPEPSVFEIQLKKLAHTWEATDVTVDGTDKTSDYASFELTLTDTGDEILQTYTTTGRPSESPWKANGEWAFNFDGEAESKIQRDGGAEAIEIQYVVTETTLQLTFYFLGNGYSAKTKDSTGTWVFKFEKK